MTTNERLNLVDFKLDHSEKHGLLDAGFFLHIVNDNGLFFPRFHFHWLEENDLIIPLNINVGKKYYSSFQMPLLDVINDFKIKTLEYPNPKYVLGRQLVTKKGKVVDSPGYVQEGPMLWQDYVLSNKETIIANNKEWNDLIKIIHLTLPLHNAILEGAFRWYHDDKRDGEVPKAELKMHVEALKAKPGRQYAEQISRRVPNVTASKIRMWATSTLSAYVIMHNPLYEYAHQYPVMEEVFNKRNAGQTIFRKNNDVAIANFYVQMMEYVSFYLECLEGAGIGDINKILAAAHSKGIRNCAICNTVFVPRTWGRENILCPSENCQKMRDKTKAKERRIKQKLRARASV